jgi:hypothetical protein
MVRKLERFFALTPEERAWRFRLAHRRAGLPDPVCLAAHATIPARILDGVNGPLLWQFKKAG